MKETLFKAWDNIIATKSDVLFNNHTRLQNDYK